jgi:arylsulfatase A-like enzyme
MSRTRSNERRLGMSRRQFLRTSAWGLAGLSVASQAARGPFVHRRRPPNLLFIHADQQHGKVLSAHGCRHVQTPHLDRLARRGVSFRLAYSANPICCPARAAWYTGRPGSENGVVANDKWPLLPSIPDLGQWFGARGYAAVYAGKWHVTGRAVHKSFQLLPGGHFCGQHGDGTVARAAESFLLNYKGDKPFFLSLGFLQPHDICYWVFAHTEPLAELPFEAIAAELPPLWDNFGFDPREPESFRRRFRTGRRWELMSQWPQFQWRYYRWSYYRHVEMVDAQVGHVLDVLEDTGLAHNTVVIYSSDHGDGMGAHQLSQKAYFYEEAAQVPLIISWPGELAEGKQDYQHVVSGLDLAPTLCDFAGLDPPPKCRGRSLRPLLQERDVQWREAVVCEVDIIGRMVRTPEYKLITYRGDQTDQLFDLRTDPGEMHNLAFEAHGADVVKDLKKLLAEWESQLEPAPLAAEQRPQ